VAWATQTPAAGGSRITVSSEYNAIIDGTLLTRRFQVVSITIRNLDQKTKTRLRVRAAHRNRSMEDEARTILRQVLAEEIPTRGNLAQAIGLRFRGLDVSDFRLPAREPMREPPRPDKRSAR
jgi:plasmid stability protein